MKPWLYIVVLVLLSHACFGATVHGTIYDLSLEKTIDVVVEVNTSPQQRLVSKDGTYSFTIPLGSYKISAKQIAHNVTLADAQEFIKVIDERDYVLDLFLFPTFDEDDILNETDVDFTEDDLKTTNRLLIIVIVLLVALVVVAVVLYLKLKKREPVVVEGDDDLEKVLSIIRSQGGRTTQKEIRKHMPLSEAKVSLILTELEAKGIIQKYKKGRGNIVVLRR
jgi:uncharacterized membrane protein